MSEIISSTGGIDEAVLFSLHADWLELVASGHTSESASAELKISEAIAARTDEEILEYFSVRNQAAAVAKGVRSGLLDVQRDRNADIFDAIKPGDVRIVKLYSEGDDFRKFADQERISTREAERKKDRVFDTLGAVSEPHAVYRAFEVGIFILPKLMEKL